MKTLLINPPIREYSTPRNFPIGTAYIAAYLLKNNIEVEVLDIDAYRYTKEQVTEIIKRTKCSIIGISSFITVYKYTKWLTNMIKEVRPDIKVIIGNSLATTMYWYIKNTVKFDYLVLGEGEESCMELIKYIQDSETKDIHSIKGIAYYKDKELILTEQRPLLDINKIPFPAWHLFNMDLYTSIPLANSGKGKTMRLFTTRGCPFFCKYCYHIFGHKPRQRDPMNIIEELKELNKRYGVVYASLCDDLFTVNKKRVIEFCRLVRKEIPWLHWSATGRINVIDEEMLKEMKEAKCDWIAMGIESGSQKIMDEMNRQTTLKQAQDTVDLVKKYKIFGEYTCMIGFPNETKETVQASVDFYVKNGLMVQLNFVCPYPGTALFNTPEIRAKINDLEDFMERIGDGRDFVINLTNYSDEEIFQMRVDAEQQIGNAYLKKHLFLATLFFPLRFFGKDVAELIKSIKLGQFKHLIFSYISSLGKHKKTEYRVEK